MSRKVHNAQDGPLYHPGVCILSSGAPAVIRFYRKRCEATENGAHPSYIAVVNQNLLLICSTSMQHRSFLGLRQAGKSRHLRWHISQCIKCSLCTFGWRLLE